MSTEASKNKNVYSKLDQAVVPGLTEISSTIDPVSSFGESGDIFNHQMWRDIMCILWSFDVSKGVLLALFTNFLLRLKSFKLQNKGKVAVFNIPIPAKGSKDRAGLDHLIGTDIVFRLKINFPTESSRVSENALTPERFKCIIRPYVVPEMLIQSRFPATAESVGMGHLIRALMEFELGLKVAEEMDAGEKKIGKLRSLDTDLTNAKAGMGEMTKKWLSSKSAAAGTVSTKEIYVIDEQYFPGCTAWAGMLALMTDASNKIRAPSMPKDLTYQFEKSAFYPDFKRKMAAKGLKIVQTEEYLDFLQAMAPVMSKFLRTASGMSAQESSILDKLIIEAQGQASQMIELEKDESEVLISTTGADLKDELAKMAKTRAQTLMRKETSK